MTVPFNGHTSPGPAASGAYFTQTTLASGTIVTARYTTRPSLGDANALEVAFPDWVQTGDNSRMRNLAPSQDRFYLHVDGELGSLLYGDFLAPHSKNRFVPRVGRLTGWLGQMNITSTGSVALSGFSAPGRWTEQYEEIALQGVSGPYSLTHTPVIPGSETIWLLHMDENDEFGTGRCWWPGETTRSTSRQEACG